MPPDRKIAAQYSTVGQCVAEGIRIECSRSCAKSPLEHRLYPSGHRGKQTVLEQDLGHVMDTQYSDFVETASTGHRILWKFGSSVTTSMDSQTEIETNHPFLMDLLKLSHALSLASCADQEMMKVIAVLTIRYSMLLLC
jgi:hypothetical protein